MANILVVSGSYYPYATANAACMKEFEKSLVAAGHKVTYIIKQHDIETIRYTKQGDIEIYHIPRAVDNFYKTCETLKKQNMPKMLNFLFKSSLLLNKVFMKAYTKIFYGSLRNYAEKKYLKLYAEVIEQVVEKNHIDVIISVSMPFLSHKAVLEYFKKNSSATVKWIPYIIDAYSQQHNMKINNKYLREEYEVFDRADKILSLSVLKADYSQKIFAKYQEKIKYLPLPTFSLETVKIEEIQEMEAGAIHCAFAGTLYDDIRSLEFFKLFFENSELKDVIQFQFMGKRYPKNENILQGMKLKGYKISLQGFMPSSYADASIKNADIVLNIGNLSTNQIPSKIFQYMREGKPILTFYRIKDDPAIPYLEKYPLACNVFEEEDSLSAENMAKVKKFIMESPNMKIDMEELKTIYAQDTSEAICKEFMEFISVYL